VGTVPFVPSEQIALYSKYFQKSFEDPSDEIQQGGENGDSIASLYANKGRFQYEQEKKYAGGYPGTRGPIFFFLHYSPRFLVDTFRLQRGRENMQFA
jgi:hypothetical protein